MINVTQKGLAQNDTYAYAQSACSLVIERAYQQNEAPIISETDAEGQRSLTEGKAVTILI